MNDNGKNAFYDKRIRQDGREIKNEEFD